MTLKKAKPGDKLVIRTGYRNRISRLEMVERVTPSGLVVTGKGRWNPDGYARPRIVSFNEPRARIATEADLLEFNRNKLISDVQNAIARVDWETISMETMSEVLRLLGSKENS